MKTYVTIDNLDKHYADFDDAIQAAEEKELETVTVYVHDEDGNILDSQECDRNPHSGDLVYSTWGVFKADIDDDGKLVASEILREQINSRKEAIDIALELMDYGVYIQDYSQTLSENIGDSRNEPMYIHLASNNVWLSTSPNSVDDADDAEYICTLEKVDSIEELSDFLASYEAQEANAYDACWNTGEYEDQYCPLCPHSSECSGYEDRD